MPDLTPEQIADFESRADAGERPAHLGWFDINPKEHPGYPTPFNTYLGCATISGTGFLVVWDDDGLVEMTDPTQLKYGFTSLPAAQLAAEWLLKQASEPMWRAELEELEELKAQIKALRWEMELMVGEPSGLAGPPQ